MKIILGIQLSLIALITKLYLNLKFVCSYILNFNCNYRWKQINNVRPSEITKEFEFKCKINDSA